MEKIKNNINRFLPYGDSLRNLLQHPTITKPDVKQLLKNRGVFVNDGEDETTFPFLITSLISPSEFNFLKEKLQSREDREKTITRTLQWQSDETLISAIPDNFNIQEVIKTMYPRYAVVGNPNFSMVDNNPNKVYLPFKCETHDYSKEWYRNGDEFIGGVTLEKISKGDNQVEVQITYTSPETTDVGNKVVKNLESHFKDHGYMDRAGEIERILYNDFSNEERMSFLLGFTVGNSIFTFEKASYLDISHDPRETLPSTINWLELAKVRELNINGEGLHNIHFISDKSLHKYMELCLIEILYKFSITGADGECRIRLGFPNYLPKRLSNPEFEVDIVKIIVDQDSSSISQSTLKRTLQKEFEKLKNEKYKSVKTARINKGTKVTV